VTVAADFRGALQRREEIELTVTGRRSGRETTRTVGFVKEGETLYPRPISGSDSNWYRNVLKTPIILLRADGTELRAHATPIEDPARVEAVVERFRGKYGAEQVEAYSSKLDVAVEVPLVP
jgi:hypothetical protein